MAVNKRVAEEAILKQWLGEEEYDRTVAIHGHDTVLKAFARANKAVSGGFSVKRMFYLSVLRLTSKIRIRMEKIQTWLEAA